MHYNIVIVLNDSIPDGVSHIVVISGHKNPSSFFQHPRCYIMRVPLSPLPLSGRERASVGFQADVLNVLELSSHRAVTDGSGHTECTRLAVLILQPSEEQ